MRLSIPLKILKILLLVMLYFSCVPPQESKSLRGDIQRESPHTKFSPLTTTTDSGQTIKDFITYNDPHASSENMNKIPTHLIPIPGLILLSAEPSYQKLGPGPPGNNQMNPPSDIRKQTPIWNGSTNTISIKMAQEEWESFQVLLRTQENNLSLLPKVSDLIHVGGQGRILGKNFEVAQAIFWKIPKPSELTSIDPHNYPKYFQDPIIPLTNPIPIPSDRNTLFWFTFNTKKINNALPYPGTYIGSIDFFKSGIIYFQVKLEVEVWPFKLSDWGSPEPSLKSIYKIDSPDEILRKHSNCQYDHVSVKDKGPPHNHVPGMAINKPINCPPDPSINPDFVEKTKPQSDLVRNYAEFLLNYRMYPGVLSHSAADIGDSADFSNFSNGRFNFIPKDPFNPNKDYSFKKLDSWLNYILNEKHVGIFRLWLPFDEFKKNQISYRSGNNFNEIYKDTLKKLYYHHKNSGRIKKHFYFIDSLFNHENPRSSYTLHKNAATFLNKSSDGKKVTVKLHEDNTQITLDSDMVITNNQVGGPVDLVIKNISDEPYNQYKVGHNQFRFLAGLAKESIGVENQPHLPAYNPSHPGINVMVAAPPETRKGWEKGQNGITGINSPNAISMNYYIEEVDEFADKNKELINTQKRKIFLVPNSFNDNIDSHGIYHRALGFFSYKHSLYAIEHWDVFAWYDDDQGLPLNPWGGVWPNAWGAGAGTMLYPGNIFGLNGPIKSMRIENNRDAIEDHDYLKILEQLTNRDYIVQKVQTLIPGFYKDMIQDESPYKYEKVFYDLRIFIGNEIKRIVNGGGFFNPKKINGKIKNNITGLPIHRAIVINKTDGFATSTDRNGNFTILSRGDGASITIEASGYQKTLSNININSADSTIAIFPDNSTITLYNFENEDTQDNIPFTVVDKAPANLNIRVDYSGKITGKSIVVPSLREQSNEIHFSAKSNGFNVDWSQFNYLTFDVYNDDSKPIKFELALIQFKKDAQGNPVKNIWDEFEILSIREIDENLMAKGQKIFALPKQITTITFSLKETTIGGFLGFTERTPIERKNIDEFIIIVDNSHGVSSRTFYLDNIRLIK